MSSARAGKVIGIAVASIAMLALLFIVSDLVVRWCPRGHDCKSTSQVLFGLGIMVSLAVSTALGFVARDIADRMADRRLS